MPVMCTRSVPCNSSNSGSFFVHFSFIRLLMELGGRDTRRKEAV